MGRRVDDVRIERIPPWFRNATTVSCSWANNAIRSGFLSPFRSAGIPWIDPVRLSI